MIMVVNFIKCMTEDWQVLQQNNMLVLANWISMFYVIMKLDLPKLFWGQHYD